MAIPFQTVRITVLWTLIETRLNQKTMESAMLVTTALAWGTRTKRIQIQMGLMIRVTTAPMSQIQSK